MRPEEEMCLEAGELLLTKRTFYDKIRIKICVFAQTGDEANMTILVLSDSHSALQFMRRCIEQVKPDAMIHLGDYFDDGLTMKEEHPFLPVYQVPGNCDYYSCPPGQPAVLVQQVCGVRLYMTHGHLHRVKLYREALLKDARASGAEAALFGHTHEAYCAQEDDGLWVLNPGSCGYFGGSAGVIETDGSRICSCRILREGELS